MQVELKRYLELSVDFSESFSNVLIVIGIGILAIATLACICTIKGQTTLLYLYTGLLTVILIMEVVVAMSVFSYKNRLIGSLEASMTKSLQKYGPNNVESQDFDYMQAEFQCCGIYGPKDWERPLNPIPTPASCCLYQPTCDVQDETNVYYEGCYKKIFKYLDQNMARVGTIAFGIGIFPLLAALLACCMASGLNKIRYEQVE